MQQNRFPEAIVAANGTSTSLVATSSYAVAVGELAFSTDTKQVYVAGSLTGGDFLRVLTETSVGVASVSTSFTTPLLIGGTGTTSSLTYKTTTGVGTTGADHIFVVGNNGATEAMRILNSGKIGIGVSSPLAQVDIGVSGSGKQAFLNVGEPGFLTTYGFRFYTDANTGDLTISGFNNSILTSYDLISLNRSTGNFGIGMGSGAPPVSKLHIPVAPTASANVGLVSLGNGAWDGATAGFFSGSSSGTLIAGNLASGSTSDLLNLQVAGVNRFKVANNGNIYGAFSINPLYAAATGYISTNRISNISNSTWLELCGAAGVASGNASIYLGGRSTHTFEATSGVRGIVKIHSSINPTSGTAEYNFFNIEGYVNQTGGANGITRGLYVNTTLTAAADFRAIETANNTGYAIKTSGTAISKFGGSLEFPYVAKTANYTLTSADYTVECTTNTFTITLPTAVGCAGRIYNIKNSGTGVITVDTTSGQYIDATLTVTLNQWDNLTIQSNGTNWIIL